MSVPPNTVAVLELPSDVADRVVELRRRADDWKLDPLPPHITLIGSNGVGPFRAGQDLARVRHVIEQVAAATPPLKVELGTLERFPDSDVVAFRLRDDLPVRALHESLTDSGLEFEASPWPFEPHVTLWRRPTTHDEITALAAARWSAPFTLGSIAVYSETTTNPAERAFDLLFRTEFGH